MLALDLDYGANLDDAAPRGGGRAIRIGGSIESIGFTFTPELTLSYFAFSASASSDLPAESITATAALAGCRIRLLPLGVFAHVGVGHAGFDRGPPASTGAAFDLGATVDISIVPLLDIGFQGALNVVAGDRAIGYATIGAHAALLL